MVWRKIFWNINYSKAALKDKTNTALLRELGRVVDNDGAEKENAIDWNVAEFLIGIVRCENEFRDFSGCCSCSRVNKGSEKAHQQSWR